MSNKKIKLFCVTDKPLPDLENTNLILAGVGKYNFSSKYIDTSTKINIFHKEEYYSELTFHYWYWKNLLNTEDCDWINKNSTNINYKNIHECLLKEADRSWENSNTILCDPINISGAKKIKLIKRGWRNIISNPKLLFGIDKETIKVHFDMHHGYGNLSKAINLLDEKDRVDFKKYVNTFSFYNPHIMFNAKPEIIEKWFSTLFPWLERCEEIFGFENLVGYDTKRIYAYLAERYLSFRFKKYAKIKTSPWAFINQ